MPLTINNVSVGICFEHKHNIANYIISFALVENINISMCTTVFIGNYSYSLIMYVFVIHFFNALTLILLFISVSNAFESAIPYTQRDIDLTLEETHDLTSCCLVRVRCIMSFFTKFRYMFSGSIQW